MRNISRLFHSLLVSDCSQTDIKDASAEMDSWPLACRSSVELGLPETGSTASL